MKKAFLSGALVMAAASFIAIGAQATSADAALDAASTSVDCTGNKLILHSERDSEAVDFKFYTTASVKEKSIPANNKWIKLDGTNEFQLDSAKQVKLFFAESPNPADWTDVLEVVVPAQRKLTGVTYTVGKDTAKETFLKSNAKLGKAALDDKALEMITVDGGTSLKDYFGSADYREAQKKGATLEAVYPSDVDDGSGSGGKIKFTVADSSTDPAKPTHHLVAKTNESDTDTAMLRDSLPCTIKIKQASAAPAVKIDYANHTIALQNHSYAKVDDYDAADTDWYAAEANNGNAVTWNKVTSKTNVPVVANSIYAVGVEKSTKGPRSLLTYIKVPSTPTFADLDASVSVVGKAVPKDGATQNDTVTLIFRGGAKNDIKYQYKIVDKAEEYFDAAGNFKYDKLVGKETTQVWTTVSTKAGKIAKVALKNKGKTEFAGKDIIVRVASDKTRFSSLAVALKNGASRDASWKFYDEGTGTVVSGDSFDGNLSSAQSAYIEGEYTLVDGNKAAIKITPTNAVFETAYPGEDKITVSAAKPRANGNIATAPALEADGSISFALPEGVNTKAFNGVPVTVTLPEGYVKANGKALPAQTITVNVDNVGPKIATVAGEKVTGSTTQSTLTITLDCEATGTDVDSNSVSATPEGAAIDPASIIVKSGKSTATTAKTVAVTEAKLKKVTVEGKSTYTIEAKINTPADQLKIATLYVSLAGDKFTDVLLNKSAGSDDKTVGNPQKNLKAAAAKLTPATGQKAGADGTATVNVDSNKDLDKSASVIATVVTASTGIDKDTVVVATPDVQDKKIVVSVTGATTTATDADGTITIKLTGAKDADGFELAETTITLTVPKAATPDAP